MTVVSKAKQNPFIAVALLIGSLAVAGTATWAGVGLVDKLHTTEAELLLYDLKAHTFASNQFTGLETKLEEAAVVSKCRWLSSEIRALKDAIYVRRRDGADPDYINSLESDLEELTLTYQALTCAQKLA